MSLHETLTAHPLLSPHTSPHTSPDITPPKYVPYTPRQRASATTTGTTVTASVSNSPRDATSKLQLMNLKAAAQTVGLDTGTVGWAILEKLVLESSGECSDIWQAVTVGRATLLLPLETAATHEQFNAEFVKDHVVLCDGSSRKSAPVLTLSGLRGVLNGQTLTLRSSVHPSSKQFQHLLLDPTSRSSDLALLPPLPLIPSTQSPYPAFSVPSYTSSLPLPPLTKSAPKPKPPLPPRPTSHPPALAASQTPSQSRLSFASLFGKPTPTPTPTPPIVPISASPTPSILSLDSTNNNQDSEHGAAILVNAFTLDRRIVRKDIEKEIGKGLKGEVEGALAHAFEDNDKDATEWIAERVHEFTRDAGLYPFVKSVWGGKRKLAMLREKNTSSSSDREDEWVVNSLQMSPEDMEERFQTFYSSFEEELNKKGLDEQREGITEVVERTICRLFYDRLFLQPTSDDASHDDALSSRVAALNMLDLSLEHLDVDVGDGGEQLELVVKACGEALTRLDDATSQSPGEKAAILVAAHKIIVDGISKLPPIRLKSEVKEEKTRKESQTNSSSKLVEKQTMEVWVPEAATVTSPSSELGHEHGFDVDPTQQVLPPSPDQTNRPKSPALLISPPSPHHPAPAPDLQEPLPHTTVSGDILLPLIIFSVVKANPPHLVSHLLYTQRFRNHSIGGEESYCLVNLLAVAEFLENVDLGALGLGGSDKVMSTADLTPIPINRSPMTPDTPTAPPHPHDAYGGIRGRVEQQVDAIAGSANKVITGVVDSSFGILRSFSLLPTSPDPVTPAPDGLQVTAPWNSVRPGFGLLRRESGFSIAGIAAALPGGGGGGSVKSGEEVGQPLLAVSRPASVKSYKSSRSRADKGDGSDSSEEEEEESGDEEEEDAEGSDEDEEEEEDEDDGGAGTEYDTRSIRSFESMMSAGKKRRNVKRGKDRNGNGPRKSLTDRLAHMSAALKGTPPVSRRSSSLLPPGFGGRLDTPASSRPQSPLSSLRLAPPNQRFLECSEDDIKISEVKELLKEYRRLVEAVRAVDGFDE